MIYIFLVIISYTKNNPYFYNQYKNLAFNINVIYKISNHKQKTINSIYIEGLTNFFFKNQVLKCLKININDLLNINIKKKYLWEIINTLKKSGFLNLIKSSIIINDKTKHFIIILRTNPILKKIKIKNIKRLLLPKTLIIQIFNNQIGLPKNYIQIHESLKTIKDWYKIRGFKWTTINLLYAKNNEIYIDINEGKIKETKLICNNPKDKYLNDQLNVLIQDKLNIFPGNILNIQRIELGIINLKENKLISNCTYKIIRNTTKDIIVIVKYSLHYDRTIYLFTKNIALINLVRYNWSNIIKFIFDLPIYNIPYLLFSLNQYIGFKYYLCNISNHNHYFVADIRNINNFPQLNFIYSYPYISKNMTGYLNLNIFKKKYKFYNIITIPLRKIYHIKVNPSSQIFQNYGIKVIFKHNLFHNISLTEKFIIYDNISHKQYLNIQSNNKFININHITKKKIFKIAKHKLIHLQIYLKYNTLDFNYKIKSGKLFIFHSQHFINLSKTTSHKLSLLNYYGQNLYVKYKENFIIPKIIQYIKKNIIVFCLELQVSISKISNLLILEDNFLLKDSKLFNSSFSFYSLDLEYQIIHSYYSALYIYINYKNSIFNYREYLTLISKYFNQNNINIIHNFGIGIQINIPVKKIPSLRLEYIINTRGNKYFQLRSYSKYST